MSNCSWVSKATFNQKPWGREIVASSHSNIAAKLITINAGEMTSFKYNNIKFESLVVLKGRVRAYFANSNFFDEPECTLKTKLLEVGDCLNVQCGCPYRLEALTTSQILEIGNCTNNETFNTIRIIDEYGRESKESTQEKKEKIKKCIQNL